MGLEIRRPIALDYFNPRMKDWDLQIVLCPKLPPWQIRGSKQTPLGPLNLSCYLQNEGTGLNALNLLCTSRSYGEFVKTIDAPAVSGQRFRFAGSGARWALARCQWSSPGTSDFQQGLTITGKCFSACSPKNSSSGSWELLRSALFLDPTPDFLN